MKRNDLIKKRIFSFLETFRHEMITQHYGYPETSRNRPKFAKGKSRFQYLCMCADTGYIVITNKWTSGRYKHVRDIADFGWSDKQFKR